MLENVFTLPRHSGRNASLAESIGQYIMRKFGTIGLLTGTQVFQPSQFHDMVSCLLIDVKSWIYVVFVSSSGRRGMPLIKAAISLEFILERISTLQQIRLLLLELIGTLQASLMVIMIMVLDWQL